MSYISTVRLHDDGAIRQQVRNAGASVPDTRLGGGIIHAVGAALAATVEGTVFLTVMGGLSLTFCVLVAGGY